MKVNFQYCDIKEAELLEYSTKVNKIKEELESRKDNQNDFVGWLNIVTNTDYEEIKRIKEVANTIRNKFDTMIVIGIGGSYLGAKALTHAFGTNKVDILYVGNNISTDYINDIIEKIKNKNVCINVISKSGTTTEPAIAFRIFKQILIDKYDNIQDRIFVTTDSKKGALKTLADKYNYESFVIKDNVGGRYSVLTPVGLLPLAVAGLNIDNLIEGAKTAYNLYKNNEILNNDCTKYAVIRNILYNKGKNIEILANYDFKLHYLGEWWKQLFGESEGKDNKGVFPSIMDFTTDLHSMGQYIQEGIRNIFETTIFIDKSNNEIIVNKDEENYDNLNYLEGKTLDYINMKAMEATTLAHYTGGVNNIIIRLEKLDETTIGKLIFFFEYSCAISCMLLEVNPFNQPGVEEYKKNMFKLLGKPTI